MKIAFPKSCSFVLGAAAAVALLPALHAAALPNRLSANAGNSAPAPLPQAASARVAHSTALGHLSGTTQLESMSLVLLPSAAQSAALDQLLADQQNPASPRYHQWLTPAQYGAQFGVSDSDLQVLQSWLSNQGFSVLGVAPSRNQITFSGTASTAESAFHTELDRYSRNGQQFFANSTAPQIPAELQNVVGAIRGLSSYRLQPRLKRVTTGITARPDYTAASGNHYLVPWDFRQIYNANGLFNSGYTGTGVSIAVLGQSAVDPQQLTYFQQLTGQTVKAPTMVLMPGSGVGIAKPGDEGESESDLEYTSGVAPGASIYFVYTGSSTSVGVGDALNYAITHQIAPILSYSYSGCETENSLSELTGMDSFLREMNAQGQTLIVAAGDSGSAGCDLPGQSEAYDGLQVNYPASSVYATAMGGSMFADTTGNYWASSNNSQGGSATGYIPEAVWNETYTSTGVNQGISGAGGGFSRFFGKPNWQVATGVPNDGARDLPDISFSAGTHDAYNICTSDTSFQGTVNGVAVSGQCTATAFGAEGKVGGTSLPTPSFAGALAMVMQANSNTSGLGNINPLLYSLYSSKPSVFHDITSGNNSVPCASGTIGCVNGTEGYNATAGYDLATGLGSMDIGAFSSNIAPAVTAVSKTPSLSVTILGTSATSIVVSVRVSSNTGVIVPTGNVTVSIDGGTPQTAALSASTSYGAVVVNGITFTGTYSVGTHTVAVSYAGDTNFNAATASSIATVSATNGGLTLSAAPTTLTINSANAHSGSWTLNLASTNGYSGVVGFAIPVAASGSSLPTVGCFIFQGVPDYSPLAVSASISPNATLSTTVTYSYSSTDCNSTYSVASVVRMHGNTAAANTSHAANRVPAVPEQRNLPLLAIGFTGLLGSACLRRRRVWMTGLLALAAIAGTAGLSGCGSGSSPLSTGTTGGGSGTITAAPKGTYNFVISAGDYVSNSPASSVNLTLVIQ